MLVVSNIFEAGFGAESSARNPPVVGMSASVSACHVQSKDSFRSGNEGVIPQSFREM